MQRHCTLKEREEAHTDTERILCLNFLVLGLPWWLSSKERIHLPMQETHVRSLGQEDPLEKGMAIHSNILAWRIPGTEEPGGLLSIQRVRHD